MENDQETQTEEGKPVEGKVSETPKPLTKVQEINAASERAEKANAEHERLILLDQELLAERKLGGTVGGRVETPEVSEETKKSNTAQEFFKDTALGDAIKKANE